jgi:hypothetical protein
MTCFRSILAGAAVLAAGFLPAYSQGMQEGPAPTTALITAESKMNAPLDQSALKLEVNGHGTPIESLTPVRQQGAQVAILIDDGLRRSFSLQLDELEKFITALPSNVQVLVGYMQNGDVRSAGRFSTDHEQVVKELRVPFSSVGISASPYICLSEFVKHWPSQQAAPRMVLMITNGVDPYNGSVSPLNQDSPYVRTAGEDAQRAGVAVYSIYYGDRAERGAAVSFSGQSYLQQIAGATGGQAYYQGTITPPSLSPYFNQFAKAIAESYTIGFRAPAKEHHHELTHIHLKTSQSGVKIHAPDGVLAGVAAE